MLLLATIKKVVAAELVPQCHCFGMDDAKFTRRIPLVSGSSVAQLKENMQALAVRLSEKQLKLLNEDIPTK